MTLSTDGFAALLSALAAGSQQYFGDRDAILEPVSRLERPFSDLLRLRVTAAGRESHAFLKIFKARLSTPEELAQLRRFVEREFRATTSLYEAVRSHSGLNALRPVALFADDLAIVTEEVVGVRFDRLLRDGLWGRRTIAPVPDVAGRIGAWVRTYQQVIEAEGLLSLEERRDYLEVRIQRLKAAGVFAEGDRKLVLDYFDTTAAFIAPQPMALVAIHADLCPTNILIGFDGGVTILDFAMAKTCARYNDVAHLFMHLEFLRWRPRLRSHVINEAQTALLLGYDPSLSPDDPLFRLVLLEHLVCHLTFLAERQTGHLEPAYRWFLRRRWAKCSRIPALGFRGKATA